MKTCTRGMALALLLNVMFVTSSAVAQEHAIAKSGITSIHTKSSNDEIDAVFHTVRIEKTCDAFPSIEWEAKAVTLVQKLEISVQGKRLFVPRSVFADLIDPRVASIKSEKEDLVLTIAGADGAESYFVHVYFDTTKVKRRTLYSALTPSVIAEDTHYRLTVLKDE
jgi:hypothetical protein